MNILLTTLTIAVGINLIMFLPAYFLKTDKLTDISYAVTFIVLVLFALITSRATFPAIILSLMIIIWALRLGIYLLIRIRKIGKDRRFDNRREKFLSFAIFWLLQGFTVWVVLLPSIMFIGNKNENIQVYVYLGVVIWLTGLLIETVSDFQKYNFKNNAKNKGKWINEGLWKYSRHPNYFGEILLWIGVYLYTVSGLNTLQIIAGSLSPLYIALLITFVSGIPMLEKASDNRWGDNSKYIKYKKRTSILIPLPIKKWV